VESLFTVPASLDGLAGSTFFDQPFPCDLRRDDGKVRFRGFPNPKAQPILDIFTQTIDDKLDGFSPVAAGYVRFSGSLDPASLPADPGASATSKSTVQLVDVDPSSPEYGRRRRINLHYQDAAGVYWPSHTLAFMPAVGFPLRTKTRYALVVSDGVHAASGDSVRASGELKEVLGLADATTQPRRAARDALAPAVTELKKLGFDLTHVAHFTSFTTDDPTAEYFAAADAQKTAVAAPTATDSAWQLKASNADFDEYVGSYGPSPNYQAGKVPYAAPEDGGGFVVQNGVPQVQNTFDARFSLSVPNAGKCPMPAGGYPIVLYAHGTGGDFESYVHDGTARALAKQCLASMGVDQIFHGTRPGAPVQGTSTTETEEEILFFNFNNLEAARTNIRQSGLDEMQRARLFTETHLTVPASVSATKASIAFDASKLMFFGHSQGSLNGPLFLAASQDARGGVLSGASGLISITLLEKTSPQPSVANLVKAVFLALTPDQESELILLHPALALAQSIVDTVDPINYAHAIVSEPHGAAKSIYQTEGIRPDGTGDTYAPPRGCEALALAIGLDLQAPPILSPPDAAWGGLSPVSVPAAGLSGNLAGGQASGLLAQWDPGKGEGHFVVFDVPKAQAQAAGFLRALADDPKGRVPAP
jgi:predicted esterase